MKWRREAELLVHVELRGGRREEQGRGCVLRGVEPKREDRGKASQGAGCCHGVGTRRGRVGATLLGGGTTAHTCPDAPVPHC